MRTSAAVVIVSTIAFAVAIACLTAAPTTATALNKLKHRLGSGNSNRLHAQSANEHASEVSTGVKLGEYFYPLAEEEKQAGGAGRVPLADPCGKIAKNLAAYYGAGEQMIGVMLIGTTAYWALSGSTADPKVEPNADSMLREVGGSATSLVRIVETNERYVAWKAGYGTLRGFGGAATEMKLAGATKFPAESEMLSEANLVRGGPFVKSDKTLGYQNPIAPTDVATAKKGGQPGLKKAAEAARPLKIAYPFGACAGSKLAFYRKALSSTLGVPTCLAEIKMGGGMSTAGSAAARKKANADAFRSSCYTCQNVMGLALT